MYIRKGVNKTKIDFLGDMSSNTSRKKKFYSEKYKKYSACPEKPFFFFINYTLFSGLLPIARVQESRFTCNFSST